MLSYPVKLPFVWERKVDLAISFDEKLVRTLLYKGLSRMGAEDRTIIVPKDQEDPVGPLPHPLRASGLGNCARLLWYLRFTPDQIPMRPPSVPKALAAQHSGKMYEEYIRHLFVLSGTPLLRGQDTITLLGGRIQGHIDGVLTLNRTVLVEIKALFHEDVQRIQQYGVAVSKPLYYTQIQIYLAGLGLSEAFLIVLDRNETDFLVKSVPLDFPFLKEVRDKVEAICTVGDPFDIPEPFVVRDCFFCPLQSICEKQDGKAAFADAYTTYQAQRLHAVMEPGVETATGSVRV